MKPELYFNRELSWLKFNERVLEEACREDTPLFERLRFVSIFASNLDEFYMVRVGSLLDQSLISSRLVENKTGMTPGGQIQAVNKAVKELYPYRDNVYQSIMKKLSSFTCFHTNFKALSNIERHLLKNYFERELLPVLSPQIIDMRHPFPHLENKRIYIGVRMKSRDTRFFGIVPLPSEAERVVMVPGDRVFLLLEDVILHYIDEVFDVYAIESKAVFRVTRNADIDYAESLNDEDTNYREFMREMLKKRRKLSPVRLETNSSSDGELLGFFLSKLRLSKSHCFVCETPLDLSFVPRLEKHFGQKSRDRLFYTPFRPQWSASFSHNSLIEQIQQNDRLLIFPYDNIRPLTDLLAEASEDNRVAAIKMTLYRIGSESHIVQSLCTAAENGKDVTVVVELRARFDEQNNINWAAVMEDSGCKVIYGIDDFKIHSKAILISIRTAWGLKHLANISTGNYNEATSRLYSDISFFTTDMEICEDVIRFFHNMEIGNLNGSYRRLLVSPVALKSGILELIGGETRNASNGLPARIIAKMNSLTDKDIIDQLIAASQAGVSIDLVVRGICCLRPGVRGYTENIRVRSIVGRFLEHSRVYCFGCAEQTSVYIGSADMMTRNTEHRVEILAPVRNPSLDARILDLIEIQLNDNVNAHILGSNGSYIPAQEGGEPQNSQLLLCDQAFSQASAAKLHHTIPHKRNLRIRKWLERLQDIIRA